MSNAGFDFERVYFKAFGLCKIQNTHLKRLFKNINSNMHTLVLFKYVEIYFVWNAALNLYIFGATIATKKKFNIVCCIFNYNIMHLSSSNWINVSIIKSPSAININLLKVYTKNDNSRKEQKRLSKSLIFVQQCRLDPISVSTPVGM